MEIPQNVQQQFELQLKNSKQFEAQNSQLGFSNTEQQTNDYTSIIFPASIMGYA